jgi:hypothetical protein
MKNKLKSTGGLTVSHGRLINNSPIGMTGIAQAAMLRKEVKRDRKVSIIADGIIRAEVQQSILGFEID